MKSGIGSDTAKSAKNLAQAIAKQIAGEPLEVLKTAKEQTMGVEAAENPPTESNVSGMENKSANDQKEQIDKLKSARRIEALNREISDIKKQDLFKDLQERIANGEEVPLEDYPDLSIEQKQVLKAQMEAVKVQNSKLKVQSGGQLIEPQAHKGRQLFNFGKKQEVKRQQTHVEKIVPPSG